MVSISHASCSTCSAAARTRGSGSFWSRFTSPRKRSRAGTRRRTGRCCAMPWTRACGPGDRSRASTIPGSKAGRHRRADRALPKPLACRIPSVIKSVSFDPAGALKLAKFRAAVLGSEVDEDLTIGKAFVEDGPGSPNIWFTRVPEPKPPGTGALRPARQAQWAMRFQAETARHLCGASPPGSHRHDRSGRQRVLRRTRISVVAQRSARSASAMNRAAQIIHYRAPEQTAPMAKPPSRSADIARQYFSKGLRSVALSIGITRCSLTTRRGLPDPEVTARPRYRRRCSERPGRCGRSCLI
jgi:hypothetical protein